MLYLYNMEYKKKADPTTKPIKYLHNKMKGLNKKESALKSGYADGVHTSRIEKTKTYLAGLEKFKMSREDVYAEHKKNIVQDEDRGAKNKALDMLYKLGNAYPKEQQVLEEGEVKITITKG